MRRIKFLGCPMDVATMDETVSFVQTSVLSRKFIQHVVVNVAKLVNMRTDPQLEASVKSCDLINIDGMGVLLGARFLGFEVKERVTGIDLFYRLLDMSAKEGFSIYLLGARPDVLERTVSSVKKLHPGLKIAGFQHGYYEYDVEVVEDIKASGAQLLFVAMSSPKKENFINKWKSELGVNFVMGVGGTFDVVAGKVKRAPVWMQNYGLEWFYRVVQEPRRMWKRYLYTNFIFALLLISEKFKR